MNEKFLVRFFLISFVFAITLLVFVSAITQQIADKGVDKAIKNLQIGYGTVLAELITKHVLIGNNREVDQILERMVDTKVIDGFRYRSFVSDFYKENTKGDITEYYIYPITINFSDSQVKAASLEIMFLYENIFAPKRKLLEIFRNGVVAIILCSLFLFVLYFFYLRRQNRKINEFISYFLSDNKIGSEDFVSEFWSPIIETIKSSKIRLDEMNKKIEQAKVTESIARTTQMLAHDVRKPFSLFRMTLERVKTADSSKEVRDVLSEALPEVERSLASVNGLITDVLNVGGEFSLVLRPVRLASIIEDVVSELRKLYPQHVLNVKIDVDASLWVQADDTRIQRVFLNIFSNAIEAVGSVAVQLWVSARTRDDERIEVRVGNAGSYIDEEARTKLFDLFYTSGKKGGTGLGLAIVKKIISGHGSEVFCTSEKTAEHPDGEVEFVWSFARALAEAKLDQPMQTKKNEAQSLNGSERPNVVFLDDSPLARWVWDAKLKTKVSLQIFAGPREFWRAIESERLLLANLHTIITDHYFAPDENVTGVELATELRARGFQGRILLASNGEFDAQELAGIVDKIVDKHPVDWDEL